MTYTDIVSTVLYFVSKIYLVSYQGHDEEEITYSNTIQPLPVSQFTVGDWILVRYEGSLFPGEVQQIAVGEVKVSVMIPSGANYYKWPPSEDSIFYDIKNVIMNLKPPILKSARGMYEFSEKW